MKWQFTTPREVINSCNLQTDEDFTDEQLGNFFNEGIADMNVSLNLNMPLLVLESPQDGDFTLDDTYTVLPRLYMMSAMQYYVSYAIKAQDSSSTEAEYFWQKYLRTIQNMQGKTDEFIFGDGSEGSPDNSQYAGSSKGYEEYDFTGNPYATHPIGSDGNNLW